MKLTKIAMLALLGVSGTSFSCGLTVENPKAKASMPGMDNSAGYVDLTNTCTEDLLITGIESGVAKGTELHTMAVKNERMVMRQIESIKIPAGQKLELRGKYHIMFIGLKSPLKEGSQVDVTLKIKNHDDQKITLPVAKMKSAHSHDHGEKHDHHAKHQH